MHPPFPVSQGHGNQVIQSVVMPWTFSNEGGRTRGGRQFAGSVAGMGVALFRSFTSHDLTSF